MNTTTNRTALGLAFLLTAPLLAQEVTTNSSVLDKVGLIISQGQSVAPKIIMTGKGSLIYVKPDDVEDSAHSEPFSHGDYTWINGNDRRHTALLDSKYFTGRLLLDVNTVYSNQNPIDHTVVGSTTLARTDEMEINLGAIGGDYHYDNVRASILLQLGTRSTVVPRNDGSGYKGQYDLQDAYRYFSEANAGYHFNVWHGINVDAGLFMSYIGLFSYYNAENWVYQPSFTSDNTPWFFNGIRIQTFPTENLKIEGWIINGWQSYAMFNNMPGFGSQILWRPKEWFEVLSNEYYGHDDQDDPGRYRAHSDNSIEIRYYNNPASKGISRAACSLTYDIGWEQGDGVNGFHSSATYGPAQYFLSGMVYNRLWFGPKQHTACTVGAGYINNPGRYLVLAPTGQASPLPGTVSVNPLTGLMQTQSAGIDPFSMAPGSQFLGWDATIAFDWMPSDYFTWEFQIDSRHASVPYFAGPGGVTSPDGYVTTPVGPGSANPNWTPDLVKDELQFIIAFMVRF